MLNTFCSLPCRFSTVLDRFINFLLLPAGFIEDSSSTFCAFPLFSALFREETLEYPPRSCRFNGQHHFHALFSVYCRNERFLTFWSIPCRIFEDLVRDKTDKTDHFCSFLLFSGKKGRHFQAGRPVKRVVAGTFWTIRAGNIKKVRNMQKSVRK